MITTLPIQIQAPEPQIRHQDKLMLIGSCFTEHMGKRLREAKFQVLENPGGIMFNPQSVAQCIGSCITGLGPEQDTLFHLNELWNHWDFHTRFSGTDRDVVWRDMQSSVQQAHRFLKEADWLLITLGSAFQYFLNEDGSGVANCHRAPGQWFEKRLLTIGQIKETLGSMIAALKQFNPGLKLIFTVSPVRHVRDGVVDNNRSKARLIESVHEMVEEHDHCFYFPSYELLIDVLRDYRYYDVDLVHPNFAATSIVWEQFYQHFLEADARDVAHKMLELTTATHHKVRFPETQAYEKFRNSFLQKIAGYEKAYPYINFSEEKAHFSV